MHGQLLESRRGLLGNSDWGYDAMGGLAGRALPPDAHSGQHRSASGAGWASGGWISDSLVDGNVGSGTQQQWISRNSEWGSWTGSNWNMVFVGVVHPPAGEWPRRLTPRSPRRPLCGRSLFFKSMRGGITRCAFPRWFKTARASVGTLVRPLEDRFHCAGSILPGPAWTARQPSMPSWRRAGIFC